MNSMVGGTKFKQHVICAFFCLKGVENWSEFGEEMGPYKDSMASLSAINRIFR